MSLFDISDQTTEVFSIWVHLQYAGNVLLSCSVECQIPIKLLHGHLFYLVQGKSPVDKGYFSLLYRSTLLAQVSNTFPWLKSHIPLFLSIGKSSWKAFQEDPAPAVIASMHPPICPNRITQLTNYFKIHLHLLLCALKKDYQPLQRLSKSFK